MVTEIEARFAASDRSVLVELAGISRLGPAELGAARATEEVDRYLDTAGARLASARWACRLRSRGDVTRISLKGPPAPASGGPAGAWLHRRPELEGPAHLTGTPADWPPSEARDQLLALSGGEPLIEVLRLLQHRTERAVDVDGHPLGTLSLDEVRVDADGRRSGAFMIVELELAGAEGLATLDVMAAELSAWPGLRPEPLTKLERAQRMVAAPG